MLRLHLSACAILIVVRTGHSEDVHAKILHNEAKINENGAYKYAYATSNDIAAVEFGVGAVVANGGFAYTAPEGQLIKLQYTADENGFQPQADHLPTPHPIPLSVIRSLEYIRAHNFDTNGSR